MFILSDLLLTIVDIIDYILTIYIYIIIGRAIISWFSPDPYNPIVRFLYQVTEPVLVRVRRVLPSFGGLDFSPFIVILLIYFLQRTAIHWLRMLAVLHNSGIGVLQ